MEFTGLKKVRQAKSTVRTLNFSKTKFQLFKELTNRTPLETALREKAEEQSWPIFEDTFCTAQELTIPMCKKLGKKGKRPAG